MRRLLERGRPQWAWSEVVGKGECWALGLASEGVAAGKDGDVWTGVDAPGDVRTPEQMLE